jgi:hypothetical protein
MNISRKPLCKLNLAIEEFAVIAFLCVCNISSIKAMPAMLLGMQRPEIRLKI